MLSEAAKYKCELNPDAKLVIFGQDYNAGAKLVGALLFDPVEASELWAGFARWTVQLLQMTDGQEVVLT